MRRRTYQNGSALVIGLVLLLALTILGVAGMGISRTALMMAANLQFYNSAKAAGAGQADFNMDQSNLALGTSVMGQPLHDNLNAATGAWSASFLGSTPVPGGGFSANGSFAAMHYEITVDITKTGIPLEHQIVQGAYMIGPGQ